MNIRHMICKFTASFFLKLCTASEYKLKLKNGFINEGIKQYCLYCQLCLNID